MPALPTAQMLFVIDKVVGLKASTKGPGRVVLVRWSGKWPAEQKETWEPEEGFAATAGGRRVKKVRGRLLLQWRSKRH